MSQVTLSTFEQSVGRYFEPIARRHGWPLLRRTPEVYEIPSPHFVMRVRFDVGAHTKAINATLIPVAQMPGDIQNGGKGELGIGVIAGYNGVAIQYTPWQQTEEGIFEQSAYVANMAATYGVPYLLGQKCDWNDVKNYLAGEIAKDSEKIKAYKFPPSVQKRWHLPPPHNVGDK